MRGYRSTPEDYLFHKGDWHATQEGWRNELVAKIGAMNGDELLNISTTDLARYYVDEYTFEVPVIHDDELVVDQRETKIDVSQDRDRIIHDRSRPVLITGTTIDVEVPFTGNKVGFDIQPSTRNFNNPMARVRDGVVEFSVTGTDLSAERVKQEIERVLNSINTHLGWLANDANGYNAGLENLATRTIERRKEKLLKDKSLVAGLGFRMKERPGAKETFAAPKVRRNIRPQTPKPTASKVAYNPEPILTDDDYEHILSVLANMVSVMEQSPGAFREIDEESLRTHFLMQLNGHFSGDATGETFNYEGKTDILIKVDGRNIFIGECKFWTGEKGYLETLDQVLSYLSWRDTKAAVLIFSRNKDFTGVLEKIEESTHKHPNCKKLVKKRNEGSWTYLFGHKDDANREISITVQAYNVPERIEPRTRTICT
ncbi:MULTISPECIES: hypothetical protein [Roseovarius]|uniref:hypothetical protein n=1 Tax=Roseovarius TaxID=74030 RepID=UPI001B805A99|nr:MULTISPECIES: hypothetical protein [Roseovarius]